MATAATTMVHARVNATMKKQAAKVFEEVGLTMSDVFRLLIVKTAQEKTLPFEIWVPNKTTVKAMEDARAGRVSRKFDSMDELFKDLKK